MTSEEAIKILEAYKQRLVNSVTIGLEEDIKAYDMAIKALRLLDKLDEIITEQIDISYDQTECQTLRWVLDKMSEEEE